MRPRKTQRIAASGENFATPNWRDPFASGEESNREPEAPKAAIKNDIDDEGFDDDEYSELLWRFWEAAPVVEDAELGREVRLLRGKRIQMDLMYKTAPRLHKALSDLLRANDKLSALRLLRRYRDWLVPCGSS